MVIARSKAEFYRFESCPPNQTKPSTKMILISKSVLVIMILAICLLGAIAIGSFIVIRELLKRGEEHENYIQKWRVRTF